MIPLHFLLVNYNNDCTFSDMPNVFLISPMLHGYTSDAVIL
jgi:hypothetical protein